MRKVHLLILFICSGIYSVYSELQETTNANTRYRIEWLYEKDGSWKSEFMPNVILSDSNGTISVEVPTQHRLIKDSVSYPTNQPGGFVSIPVGHNVGTNPITAIESYNINYPETYSLTVRKPFYMLDHEVTNSEYNDVLNWALSEGLIYVADGGDGYNYVYSVDGDWIMLRLDPIRCEINHNTGLFFVDVGREDNPVVMVTWYGACMYCNFRGQMEGLPEIYNSADWSCNFLTNGYRLPTEDEWEYAARGGVENTRYWWGNEISHSNANYQALGNYSFDLSAGDGKHPAITRFPNTNAKGMFPPNPYGLYDMGGNVVEWCWDQDLSHQILGTNNIPPSTEKYLRGGDWNHDAKFSCVYIRYSHREPEEVQSFIGFRIVKLIEGY